MIFLICHYCKSPNLESGSWSIHCNCCGRDLQLYELDAMNCKSRPVEAKPTILHPIESESTSVL